MTTPAKVWRVLVGIASLVVGFRMAFVVDSGTTRSWEPAARYAWGIGLLGLMLFGVGMLALVIRPLLTGETVKWFPSRAEIHSPRSAWIVIVAGAILLCVVLILPSSSMIRARAAFSAMGIILVLGVQIRPDALWNAGSTRTWRALFGDRATVWMCTLIGIAIVVWSWFFQLGS